MLRARRKHDRTLFDFLRPVSGNGSVSLFRTNGRKRVKLGGIPCPTLHFSLMDVIPLSILLVFDDADAIAKIPLAHLLFCENREIEKS